MKPVVLAFAAATFAIAAPASATTVIAQSQWIVYGGFGYIDGGSIAAQSFTPSYDNSVGAGVFLTGTSSGITGTVTITLYDGFPPPKRSRDVAPLPVGQAIATGSASGTRGTWVDVSWAQVPLLAGQTYYIGVTSPDRLSVAYSLNGRYGGGSAYYGVKAFPDSDLVFRTYANDAPAAAVPEPASWALMLTGFGMAGFGLRRRAKRTMALAYAK